VDLAAAQDLRKLLALARRAEVGGRIVTDLALAPQVAVEGTQAGGLALERRGRDRRPVPAARGKLAQERREVHVLGRQHVGPAAAQERPELQKVRAVRLERVARQPALELEIGEEVEDVVLERPRLGGGVDGHA
jgi:hypothetical protein